jgi:hypothetical protein
MKIFTELNLKNLYFKDFSFDGVNFVNSKIEADIVIEKKDFNNSIKPKDNHIYLVRNITHNYRKDIRKGYCVDNRIDNIPTLENFCFSTNDLCDIPYLIPIPFGPIRYELVSQNPKYWLNYNIKNDLFHNKVYWCGRQVTHESRKTFFQFYRSINDPRFDISISKYNGKTAKTNPKIFTNHIDRLLKSDAAFVLRGDKPYALSFFDVIMSGCIPIMISSMNDYGWENIFENVDDYMLRFDLREHSMEYIHQQVALLLEDKERVLRMKSNIANFYNIFFRHYADFGFGEFLLAKCIQIYKNDFDIEKVDDKFICSEVLKLKGIDGKL